MKKFFFAFLLLAISCSIPILLAARTTPTPKVDTPLSPVNAQSAMITGTADAFSQITVLGGLYDIDPVSADKNGNFAIAVSLVQESENTFWIQAENDGAKPSEAVEVKIEEGAAITKEYEAQTNEDHTAPAAPSIPETSGKTVNATYTIEGSGEAGAKVIINNSDSGEKVDSNGSDGNGKFSIECSLSGGDAEDIFTVALQDKFGNLSAGVQVYVSNGEEEEIQGNEVKKNLTDIIGHWAEQYILRLYNEGAVSGYKDKNGNYNGLFGPDDPITRAELVKIVMVAFELPLAVEESSEESMKFTDIAKDSWYEKYVIPATSTYGIVQGYNDNTFKPNNYVTRGEALKIILEAGGISNFGLLTPNFSDVDNVNDWFAKYTAYAKSSGLIAGYGDGTFRGNKNISRAEVCKIVIELIDSLAVSE